MSRLSLSEIVDLDRYPIDQLDGPAGQALVAESRAALTSVGACDLRGFLRPAAIEPPLQARSRCATRATAPSRRTTSSSRAWLPIRSLPTTRATRASAPARGHGIRRRAGRVARARAVRVRRAAALRRRCARDRAAPSLRRSAGRAELHVLRARGRARLALRRRRLRHAAPPGTGGRRHVRVLADAAQRRRPQRRRRARPPGGRPRDHPHDVGRARHARALPRPLEPAPGDADRRLARAHQRHTLVRPCARHRLGEETYRLFYGRTPV